MQIIFNTNNQAKDFSSKNTDLFPKAPDKCPFKNCKMPVKLKKHGFYSRCIISSDYYGDIFIRRYICPVCGRTISFLPVFVLRRFIYSATYILDLLILFYKKGISLLNFILYIADEYSEITRRHMNYYRKRLINNRNLIQYALNLINPECAPLKLIPDNQIWVKAFLTEVHKKGPQAFLFEFSNITGRSFMTTNNMVA